MNIRGFTTGLSVAATVLLNGCYNRPGEDVDLLAKTKTVAIVKANAEQRLSHRSPVQMDAAPLLAVYTQGWCESCGSGRGRLEHRVFCTAVF